MEFCEICGSENIDECGHKNETTDIKSASVAVMCPKCKNTKLDYDVFEDMYRCRPCYIFFYPEEVGATINEDAPIFKQGGKNEIQRA